MKVACSCIILLFCFGVTVNAQKQQTSFSKKELNKDTLTIKILEQYTAIGGINAQAILLFKPMPYSYQNKKRPLFCELEYQLSRAIKKKVKFGVEPTK